jgi:hypothetical protein
VFDSRRASLPASSIPVLARSSAYCETRMRDRACCVPGAGICSRVFGRRTRVNPATYTSWIGTHNPDRLAAYRRGGPKPPRGRQVPRDGRPAVSPGAARQSSAQATRRAFVREHTRPNGTGTMPIASRCACLGVVCN